MTRGLVVTFDAFDARCQPAAADIEDRLHRYVSSWRDWDAAADTLWPLRVRAILGRFPWERR